MVWVVGMTHGAKRWLPSRLLDFHPDQEAHPGEVLMFGENGVAPTWVSRRTAVQYLKITDARYSQSSSPLQPPILPSTMPNIRRYNNRRGCAFYEYLGPAKFNEPPVSIANADLGVLFLHKLDVMALQYHAAWMVAEINEVKHWVRCRPFILHPDQKKFPGKVLSLRRNTTPSPAWVPRRIAVDMATRDGLVSQ